ncbi:D-alanyl-D-alanine carboxypeptidase family protein [Rhizobium sp. L1K21]|uniref:D-alanyl-D-alanine carboxypeptidase family protein n=1 Tax=Rhizobium sp. L1K21 TaxID=2954933 RepID=UPI0020924A0F|nr:D-alanyl-D-alanine carboxypeptidase family protein [Rhizobium sp. L1K21]MCO6188136.1 D-alanyl-D-alanine carboxypeptidase [Rhizobium sp. L1K21]
MTFSGGRIGFKLLFAVLLSTFVATSALARPHILVDVRTGKVLEHKEAFQRWYPASLTKIMTAYLAFSAMKAGRLRPDSPVVMSKHAVSQPPSKMYFKPGDTLTLDSALKILLVKSANDIAVAIAETVAGSEQTFVDLMNSEARRIGMISSRFVNPNGLPGQGQYTTARDLAVLSVAVRREFPEYAHYFAVEGVNTGKKQYTNYNLLIGRFRGADGMKTGYICSAGFNQISSATRGGRTLVAVVLGADSLGGRADLSADLLEKGFQMSGGSGPTLAGLAPYGSGRDVVMDIRDQICTKEARQERAENRDEAGRMVLHSAYISEFSGKPDFAFTGLIATAKPVAADGGPNIHRVPIPLPRPANF